MAIVYIISKFPVNNIVQVAIFFATQLKLDIFFYISFGYSRFHQPS